MTASNKFNKYYCGGGKVFEMWLEAYGFTITNSNDADVIIIDYETWKNTTENYSNDSLVVIVASYEAAQKNVPPHMLSLLLPLDYMITVERIIKLLEAKREEMTSNKS